MESKRQHKYARLIQRELGDIFQKDQKHLFSNAFITVTKAAVSPDLGVAKIYLSFLMAKDVEKIMYKLNSLKKSIRKQLGDRIGNQVRKVPELIFYHDDSADYAARIENILSELDIPPADAEETPED